MIHFVKNSRENKKKYLFVIKKPITAFAVIGVRNNSFPLYCIFNLKWIFTVLC